MSEIKDKNYADVSGDKQGRKLIEDKKMSKGKYGFKVLDDLQGVL